ncbi:VOC family protein [Lacinutrix iliipiscaria]|uniref:VOC family protein n=1 Tax=Lacinutrix iliipiscaria TaxID=1230532 RepID=A0ABW5WRY7_9FLAO
MRIKELSLFTKTLELEKIFYSETLGFKILKETDHSFTLKIGWSRLTFMKSDEEFKYHYCFLIPSNKLEEAMAWIKKRVTVLDIDKGREIQHFESWNADSFYFFDASGNVAEFIVRYDLKNQMDNPFSIEDVICVNEIGVPTTSIKNTNSLIEKEINSCFWKGNTQYFGTNGTQEGLFLLPNYKTRAHWFPTDLPITPSPFKAIVENHNILYDFEFTKEVIKIKKN